MSTRSYDGWSNNMGRGSLYYHEETGWVILNVGARSWMLFQEDITHRPDPTPSIVYRCPMRFPTVKMAVAAFEGLYRKSQLVSVDRDSPSSQFWQVRPDIGGDHILIPVIEERMEWDV